MKTKTVQQVLPPPSPHMVGDGFRVHNFFPGGYNITHQRMSPFLMLDYNSPFDFSPSAKPRGVDVHPHKGFETVTIAYHGRIAHHDSTGNSGVIREGEVQWMTAGNGILHKEYHEEEFSRKGGKFQMVQLWVNLPAKDKSTPPRYQAITKEMITRVPLDNDAGMAELIAGEFNGHRGPANTFTPIHIYNVHLRKGGRVKIDLPSSYNTGILTIEGSVKFNEKELAPADHFTLFKNDGEEIVAEAQEDSTLLVISGEPINEPVVAHGPFVMNTRQEIMQAISDFQAGKFGTLE